MSEKLNKEGLTKVWLKVWTLVKTLTGDVDVSGKGTLQTQINNLSLKTEQCFQSASDGKTLVANAVTGKGVPTSADDTFATMADNIAAIQTSAALQSKSAALSIANPSVELTPDSGYDGLSKAVVSITLQEKAAALSTVAQDITPDSGKVLSKVTVPAVPGTAGTGDVLSGKTFSSGSAGVNKTGAMANQGAWVGETSGNGNVAIPKGYHDGNGYVKGEGAYNAGKSAGTSAAKVGTAGTGDVLSGKTFTNASTVGATGAMANKGGTTVDAGSVTQDSSYTYLGIPSSGYYSSGSKVRAKNSDLDKKKYLIKNGVVQSGYTFVVKGGSYTTYDGYLQLASYTGGNNIGFDGVNISGYSRCVFVVEHKAQGAYGYAGTTSIASSSRGSLTAPVVDLSGLSGSISVGIAFIGGSLTYKVRDVYLE